MNGQSSVTDVVGFFVFLAAIIFSKEVAAVIGPYMLIIAAAAVGASFALIRQQKTTRVRAVGYFARVCGAAVILSGLCAYGVALLYPALSERSLLAPVSFAIGLVGNDWGALGMWAARKVSAWVDVLISLRGGPKGGGGGNG
jgi:uncharacterized membrane protein YiaA